MNKEFKTPGPNLTDEDFRLADRILDSLIEDPKGALRLYMRAKPEVKKMLGNFDPRELLTEVNPNVDSEKVIEYIEAYKNGDELGMRRAYKNCNPETQREIDELLKE